MDARLAGRHVLRAKFLYVLLVGTTALSVLTVLMAISFRDTAMGLRLDQLRAQTLNTQLAVVTKDGQSPYFSASDAGTLAGRANVRYVVDRLVTDATAGGAHVRLMGLDLAAQERAMPLPVEAASARGARAGLLVSRAFAKDHGLSLDQEVAIDTPRGRLTVVVSALCQDSGMLSGGDVAIVELSTLQGLFGSGAVTSIGLSLDDLGAVQQTKDALARGLASGLEVQQRYDTAGYESQVGNFQLALSIFSVFSVVMSVLMAASIMERLLESRRREVGVQRSLGASRRRLRAQVLLECWLALAVALACGILAYGPVLNVVFAIIGTPTGAVRPTLLPVVAVSVGFFVLVTAVGALTLQGILTAPLVVLLKGGDGSGVRRFPWRRFAAGVVLLAVVVALYVADVALPVTALAMPLLLAASVLLVPGIHVAGIGLARLVLRGRRVDVPLTEMGRRGRDFVGLLVLVSSVLCVFSVGLQLTQILRGSVAGIYGDADVMVDSRAADLSAPVCGDPDVTRCVRQVRYAVTYRSQRLELTGIDGDYASIASESARTGIGDALAELQREPDGMLVTSTLAKNAGLAVGDRVDLPDFGSRRVLAVIDSFEDGGGVQFVNASSLPAVDGHGIDHRYFLRYRAGTDVAAKVTALKDAHRTQPFDATSLVTMRADFDAATGQIFRVIWWLFGFSVAVGLVTLVNNLWVAAFRRKTEVATKLSLGLSKRAFIGERLLVGAVLGVIGGLAGTATGVGMTFLVVRVMNYVVGAARVSFEPSGLVLMILAAAIMCALASAIPAQSLVRRPLVASIKGGE